MEMYSKAPDKEADCVRFQPGLFFCRRYDGRSGWQDDSQGGLRPLKGKSLDELRRESDFYSELNRAKYCSEMKVTREADCDGLKVYVIEGVGKDGQKQELYFAKDTGLHAGTKDIDAQEKESKISYFESYQQVAGPPIKIPTKVRQVTGSMTMRLIMQEIMPNAEIPDAVFAKPTKSARDEAGAGMEDRQDNGRVVDFFSFGCAIAAGCTAYEEETQNAFTETGKERMAGWSFLYSARSKEKLEEREASPATLVRTSSNPP